MQNNRFSEKAYYVQKVHTGRGLEHNHKERQDWKFCYNWSEIWKWTYLHAHLILVFKKTSNFRKTTFRSNQRGGKHTD